MTPEHASQARVLFGRALELDPGNVEALVGTAMPDTLNAAGLMPQDRAERLATAEATLTKVLSLAPQHALAHFYMGLIYIHTNRVPQGISELERALALDRNLAVAHGFIGLGKYFIGRGEETEEHVNEALRLSPRDTYIYTWISFTGFAKFSLGAYDEAAERFRRAVEANRNLPLAHFALAGTLAHLERVDQARAAAQAGLALDPAFTISRFHASAATDNPIYLAQRQRMAEGMRKAGAPEGEQPFFVLTIFAPRLASCCWCGLRHELKGSQRAFRVRIASETGPAGQIGCTFAKCQAYGYLP